MRRDPSFPRPRQIGSAFSVGWLRSEVMEWLNSRPRAEFNGLDAVQRRTRAKYDICSWYVTRGKMCISYAVEDGRIPKPKSKFGASTRVIRRTVNDPLPKQITCKRCPDTDS